METETITDKVVKAFRKAATELEEFQLQFALGKAEAKDKYEELKKKLNATIHEAKLKAIKGQEQAEKLHALFDELLLQLALGKAETKEAFEAQQKKIKAKLHEVEVMIKTNPTLIKIYETLLEEFEKTKVKLEILSVNYKLSKLVSKDSIEKRRKEMDKIIADLQESLAKHKKPEEKKEEKSKWENFEKEMTSAFQHLKAAFAGK